MPSTKITTRTFALITGIGIASMLKCVLRVALNAFEQPHRIHEAIEGHLVWWVSNEITSAGSYNPLSGHEKLSKKRHVFVLWQLELFTSLCFKNDLCINKKCPTFVCHLYHSLSQTRTLGASDFRVQDTHLPVDSAPRQSPRAAPQWFGLVSWKYWLR